MALLLTRLETPESLAPAFDWFIQALRARIPG
jgi:hypothetical protein